MVKLSGFFVKKIQCVEQGQKLIYYGQYGVIVLMGGVNVSLR
jgi:hypothetical protein